MKARVCGCNIIESNHIAETFKNFRIDKIYGAPSNPNWVPFGDQNLLYLDVNNRIMFLLCPLIHLF